MKIETKITEITHADLVNLFSTALYGSSHFGSDYESEDYKGKPFADPNDCFEDKLAKILLNGGHIYIDDYYAEDESDFYGEIKHEWNEEGGYMRYTITLDDISKGLGKAASSSENYAREWFSNLADEEGVNFDLTEADGLLQIIVFGEDIYG